MYFHGYCAAPWGLGWGIFQVHNEFEAIMHRIIGAKGRLDSNPNDKTATPLVLSYLQIKFVWLFLKTLLPPSYSFKTGLRNF